MSALLPCPFCGGEAVKVNGFTVACAHGLCIGWTVRRASPHEWNRRALPAVQPDATIEALTAERDHAWEMVAKADTQVGQSLADRLQDKAQIDRLKKALEDIVADCEAAYPPSHGAIKYAAKLALKGETP